MSPTRRGGSRNGERNVETDVPADWIVCVTDSSEVGAPEEREAEGIAEQRAGCCPGAGTLRAPALLILTWLRH